MTRLLNPLVLGGLFLLPVLGCGEDWQASTHPASGQVMINGAPPEGALVQLHPTGEGPDERNSRPWGLVQADGTFTLSTYESGDGAPAGAYKLTITWPVDPTVPSPSDRLGYRYARPERSPWRVEITEGENTLPPVELTGVAVDEDPSVSASPSANAAPPMPGVSAPDGQNDR